MQTSIPNSPYFNENRWAQSVNGLALANRPKRQQAATLQRASGKLRAMQPAVVTDAQIESAKVVNVETVKVAKALNVPTGTVKVLRAAAKARGFKGYSKLRRAELLALLA